MKPTGYFGQELKVGDRIVFLARSGTHYLKDCTIHSIDEEEMQGWVYDPTNRKSNYESFIGNVVKVKSKGEKYNYKTKLYEDYEYVKRIYNWGSALTIDNDKVVI